jgi:NAD(P)-dependent dehydrogenase (short-subunit alcohol dehydrogenase family)
MQTRRDFVGTENQKSRFENKVAIVTGSASGIGLATACRLGSEGASVIIADLNADALAKAEKKVKEAGAPAVTSMVCDVSRSDNVEAVVAHALKTFGHFDVVVNNAGLMIFKPLTEHSLEDWTKILAVDLLGAFSFIKQSFLHMRKGGAIVNVSSVHAVETTPLVASYAAAKAALLSLTRSASIEGKEKGLRVNAILPGAIATPMLWENPNIKAGLEVIHQTDVGQPEDVASAIAYLASEEARFLDGVGLRVDGGRLAKL